MVYEKSYYNVKCKNQRIYLMYVRMYSFEFYTLGALASLIDSSAYKGAFRYSLRVLLVYLIIKDIRAAFGQTL